MHLDPQTLEAEICGMVAGYVGTDVDASMPLAAQGLDSLAAMELRQKLQVPQPTLSQENALCSHAGCSCQPSPRGQLSHCNQPTIEKYISAVWGKARRREHSCQQLSVLSCKIGELLRGQDRLGVTLTVLIEDPEGATIRALVAEAMATGAAGGADGAARSATSRGSLWISPSPVSVKLRLFCLPYAGGVSENVFARYRGLASSSWCAL